MFLVGIHAITAGLQYITTDNPILLWMLVFWIPVWVSLIAGAGN